MTKKKRPKIDLSKTCLGCKFFDPKKDYCKMNKNKTKAHYPKCKLWRYIG